MVARCFVVGFAVLVSAAHAATPINETRELAPNGRLEVHNVAGEIRVESWDQPRVQITGELGEGAEKLEIKGSATSLKVEVKIPRSSGFSWWGGGKSASSILLIKAPAGAQLQLNGVSADVSVRGHRGNQLRVETVSGEVVVDSGAADISLSSVSGDVELAATQPTQRVEITTVSGDLKAVDVAGELELETVSGDQTVRALTIKRLRSEGVSGDLDLTIRTLAADARVDAESVSGEISIGLPADAPLKIDAESFSGGIDTQFGKVHSEEYGPGQSLDFKAGAATARVELSTMSGGIKLTRVQQ